MIFPQKCFQFETLSVDKLSMSCLVSFSKYQLKCVIKFLFRQLMASYILLESASKDITDRENGNTEIWISW